MLDDVPLESRGSKWTEALTIAAIMVICLLAMFTLGTAFMEGLRGLAEWLHV